MRTGTAFRRGKRGVALGAAAGILAASVLGYAPGWAMTEPEDTAPPAPAAASGPDAPAALATAEPAPGAPAPGAGSAALTEAGLAEALLRDLGLTPEQFAAAGELGSRAAAAARQLRGVPGYSGIRLHDNRIIVSGTGAELQSAVDLLSGTIADVSLEAPGTAGPDPAPTSVPAPAVPGAEPSAPASAGAPPSDAPGSQLAVSTEQLFQAYLRDVGTAGLQAVVAAGGKFVIRTGSIAAAQSTQDTGGTPANPPGGLAATAAPGKISPSEFVSRYANVVLDGGAPLKPEADVPGGVGYRTDNSAICSTGFSAFDPSGLPAVLTAGHCTDDGTATTAELLLQGEPAGLLGAFQFSQLGGPGNARVLDQNVPTDRNGVALTDPGNVGTDIAVVGALRPDLDPLPAASTHGDPLQPGPDVKIIGTAAPVVGMDVCRSGWRTGWSCGTVSAVGIFLVGGPTYPADPTDVRAFNGFLSYDVQSSGGDSGGPWISGNYAVGTHSAGDDPQPGDPAPLNFAVAATLQESLEVLPGYQLELFLNKPELVAPADNTVKAGTGITGRVAAAPASAVAQGSQVRITYAGRQPFDVPVQSDGSWSFTAPEAPGPFTFTAETVNGFSRSGAVALSVVIAPSFLPAPVITTPDNQPLPELKTVEGTGTPRATVTLSGDVAGSAVVGDDGRWSVSLQAPAPYGKVNVTAVQSYPGLPDSPATTADFAVMPPPPAVTSLSDGQRLKQDALPSAIAGTGLNGADVTVSLDGTPVSGTAAGGAAPASRSVPLVLAPLVLVDGGTWRVPFPAGLATGTHALSVTQAVDGVASAPAHLTFIVDAPPSVLPAGNIRDGSLAATGAGVLVSAAIAAAAALAVGILLMVLVRRRKRHSAR